MTAYSMPGLGSNEVRAIYPQVQYLSSVLPSKVSHFLQEAIDSTFTPSACIMVCASAVDAMLKEKGFKNGKLYARINKAAAERILTEDMEKWAHQIRLDANDERHADEDAGMPTIDDAKQCVEFAKTLAEFLFVLPDKVTRGIALTTPSQ